MGETNENDRYTGSRYSRVVCLTINAAERRERFLKAYYTVGSAVAGSGLFSDIKVRRET